MRRTRYCNTLQHRLQKTATQTAIKCNTGSVTHGDEALQYTSSLQHRQWRGDCCMQHVATRCSTLQHTTTHCSTLQHIATHSNTQQHTFEHRHGRDSEVVHIHTHVSTMQRTATRCNTRWSNETGGICVSAHCICPEPYIHKDRHGETLSLNYSLT